MVSAFIPTLGRSPVLGQLLRDLRADPIVKDITVADNGIDTIATWCSVESMCRENEATLIDQRRIGFYVMWNQAIARAADTTGLVAILNDDIAIPTMMITQLARALVDNDLTLICPDYQMRLDSAARTSSCSSPGWSTGQPDFTNGCELGRILIIQDQSKKISDAGTCFRDS